jgi:hypothetical protein
VAQHVRRLLYLSRKAAPSEGDDVAALVTLLFRMTNVFRHMFSASSTSTKKWLRSSTAPVLHASAHRRTPPEKQKNNYLRRRRRRREPGPNLIPSHSIAAQPLILAVAVIDYQHAFEARPVLDK